MSTGSLVAVGEVLRPYGLRGELKVRPLTDRPHERFAALPECFMVDRLTDRIERRRIAGYRVERDAVFVRFEGVESPEEARQLQGRLLAIERESVLPPEPGHFYPWQLEGAEVVTTTGRVVGRFVRVEGSEGQALWVVVDGDRERLVPAVPEIVVDVSVADRRIVIDPPEGLLDL
jgi:16S rRNA processing protein RimM